MGRVYEGVQPQIGARVAIKVLTCETGDGEAVARFFDEARAVNRIRHESIVDVLDLGCLTDGRPYIVMEFLDGSPLSKFIARGPLPLGTAVQLVCEVLDPVGAAHAVSIVHRDLKPDNIFVTAHGRIEVLDFGIAKLGEGAATMTRQGSVLGTPAYMAPEQGAGGPIDHRADLYAMGVVLYEAVTGRRPFLSDSLYELLQMHAQKAPQPPSTLRPGLPPSLEAVILRALAKRPEERFASADEMRNALSSTLEHIRSADEWRPLTGRATAAMPAMPVPARTTAAPPRRRWTAVAAALGTAAIVAGVILVLRASPAPSPAPSPPAPTPASPPEEPAPKPGAPPNAPAKACGDAESCRASCEAGDEDGCVGLGKYLARGLGVPKDARRAHELFAKACEKGHPVGCHEAGLDLLDGTGVLKDAIAGAALVTKSCDLRFAVACFVLGTLQQSGEGVPVDAVASAGSHHKGCELGSPAGCTYEGWAYLKGNGVAKDSVKAASLFQLGCDGKYGEGCMMLGYRYFDGDGAVKDPRRAAQLFQTGCDYAYGRACVALGDAYKAGSGVGVDAAQAKLLYQRACKDGEQLACDRLKPPKPASGGLCSGYGSWGMTCGGRCVNTYNSNINCGGCGHECYSGTSCDRGMCLAR